MKIQVLFGKRVPFPGSADEVEALAVDAVQDGDSFNLDMAAQAFRRTEIWARLEIVTIGVDGDEIAALLSAPANKVAGQVVESRSVV